MPDRFDEYLNTAGEQIRWKRARPALLAELRTHLLDQQDACLAAGMSREEAQAEAIRQMGDPVTTGQGLDRVHRPKAQWGLLALTGAVAVTGVILRLTLTAGWEYPVGTEAGTTILCLLLGVAALFGGYFLDYTVLARHGKALFLASAAVGFVVLPEIFPAAQVSYVFSCLYLAWLPLYAAWAYAWRGSGWLGLICSAVGLPLMAAICLRARYLLASSVWITAAVGWLLLVMLAHRDWYGLGKRRTLGLVLGSGLLVTGLAVGRALTSDTLRTRLEIALHPELDPLGGGYSGSVIQRVLEGSQWLGEGAWPGTRPYEQTMPACGGDFFLTTVLHKLGWLPFLLLVLTVFVLAGWMLARCLKQKNTLARLTVLAVVLPLALQAICGVIMNLGFVLVSVTFPLVLNNAGVVVNMGLVGLALSAFRQEQLSGQDRALGTSGALRFTRQPGGVLIRWK